MAKRLEQFPIGSNWGGFLPREMWADDFLEMGKAGLNTCRFALGFPGNTVPPLRYWDDIDYVFDLADRNGIDLLVSIITIILPRAFFERYPDIRFIDIDGQPFPRNIEDLTWPQACFNHPGYRQEVERLIDTVVRRYSDHPRLSAWSVHNEPCNPWGSVGCYCEHTIAVFRDWLRARYGGDLDALNALWQAEFATWDVVQPPRTMPKDGGNPTAWIDWMTFGEWNVTEFVGWEADQVRARDPDHQVGTNTMGGVALPITTAQSERELAKKLDFIGIDWYPSWILGRRNGTKAQMEKYVAGKLDMVRWAIGDKHPIVMEVQAGPNAESIWFGPDEMRIEAWQTVAHGYKGIYYYRWEPIVSGQEPWVHHMRSIEGQVTERIDEAGRMARLLNTMAGLIRESTPVTPEIAMLYSRESKIMAQADDLYDPQYHQALMGTYRLLSDNHYAVDWIDEEQVLAGGLAPYRVLMLPWAYCLSETLGQAIADFVRAGGIVVAEPYCATRDERGRPYEQVPGAGLDQVFGIRTTDVVNYRYWLVGHAVGMTTQGAEITGIAPDSRFWLAGLRETLEVTGEGAFPMLEFSAYAPVQEQGPALVVNRYGQGWGVYLAAGAGEAYVKMEEPYLRRLMSELLSWLGLKPRVQVTGVPDEAAHDLEITVLERTDGAGQTVFVINHAEQPLDATLRIRSAPKGRLGLRELVSFESLPVTREGENIVIACTIPARDASVLSLYRLDG